MDLLYLAYNKKYAFSLLNNQKDILFDHVRKFVLLDMHLLDLALNCINKLYIFKWVLIVRLLLQIFFYFVTRETTCCRFQNIDNPYSE